MAPSLSTARCAPIVLRSRVASTAALAVTVEASASVAINSSLTTRAAHRKVSKVPGSALAQWPRDPSGELLYVPTSTIVFTVPQHRGHRAAFQNHTRCRRYPVSVGVGDGFVDRPRYPKCPPQGKKKNFWFRDRLPPGCLTPGAVPSTEPSLMMPALSCSCFSINKGKLIFRRSPRRKIILPLAVDGGSIIPRMGSASKNQCGDFPGVHEGV